MDSRRRVVLVATLAVVVAGVLAATAQQAVAAPKIGRLISFGSCPALLSYARTQATRFVGPYGFAKPVTTSIGVGVKVATPSALGASAAASAALGTSSDQTPQQGVDYSGTNVQEVGVDEPDIVKTNGNTLFAVTNNTLQAVDVSGAQPRLLDTMQLDGGWSHELLLYGNRLLVLSRGGYWAVPLPALARAMIAPQPSSSVLTEVDVSNPSALKTLQTMNLDGSYVDARMVGSSVRIVASEQVPQELPLVAPSSSTAGALAAAKTRNASVIASSGVSKWLPSYSIKKRSGAPVSDRPLVSCSDVTRPPNFSGLGMLSVLTLDLTKGLTPIDSVAVMTDARIVYASQSSLYVTHESWADRPLPSAPEQAPSGVTTTIDKFDISDPLHTVYRGSGSVPGYLLNQWSLSEFQGVLRVVSTDTPAWWGSGPNSQSYLTDLRESSGSLGQVGQVGGLGQGDRVYAVRFVGDTGYIVTFRQVDPLYTLDISDPTQPKVLGQVDIPGYSSYLQPLGENLLLGIGQDVGANNEPSGTQLSIFDVSDLAHPSRLFHTSLGQGWSAAESNHHAFLYWPQTGLVVIPFNQGAVGFHVSRGGGIQQLGTIQQPSAQLLGTPPQINRALVVRSTVVTESDSGVKTSSLATLADVGWIAFPPQATQTPGPIPVPSPVQKVTGTPTPTGAGAAVGVSH